jgi:hypothetical protein
LRKSGILEAENVQKLAFSSCPPKTGIWRAKEKILI